MANAFYGSFLMVGLATLSPCRSACWPPSISRSTAAAGSADAVRFIAEMLGGVPSIVIGIFGYYVIVRADTGNFSGLAGGFALGVMMIPIVMRASEEAFKLVPQSLRDTPATPWAPASGRRCCA